MDAEKLGAPSVGIQVSSHPPRTDNTMASTDDPIMSDNMESFDKVSKADEDERPAHQPALGSLDLADPAADVAALACDMQRRCQTLIDEMDQFQAYLKEQKKQGQVEMRAFKSFCESEMRLLGRVSRGNSSARNGC